MEQQFRLIKLDNQGIENKPAYYLRLEQQNSPPLHIGIGESNYKKIQKHFQWDTSPGEHSQHNEDGAQ